MFYANAFSISHGENFFLVFECQVEGKRKRLCVVISDPGAKTLLQALAKSVAEAENGVEIKPWTLPGNNGAPVNYVH